ncbi:MAG: FAD-dependent oxidoreductase [Pseudomonadota bacterium]
MNESIAIVGAGIAGMCTALALAKQNNRVTIFERDIPPPEGDAEQAFFEWQRRGAAQFRHPHAFLGLMCSLLEEHHPELLAEFFAAGARRLDFEDLVPPYLQDAYHPMPGDEKLWMLLCRRATIETVLRRHVSQHPNITITNSTYVTGVALQKPVDEIHVSNANNTEPLTLAGVELTDRRNGNTKSIHQADVIIDAAGRASKFPNWFAAHGKNILEERDDAEIVYYTRHYKLKPGVSEPSRHENDPSAGDLGYMKYGVFPGDSGHFAIIICLPNRETDLRTAVKDGDRFDAICRTVPGLVPWIAEANAEPTTNAFGIGEIHAVWRDYSPNNVPTVLNFFAVGDSSVRTNPLYGRGCSTGILHAQILAGVLQEHKDATQRAQAFQNLTNEQVRPIFDASLREDKSGIRRAEAVMQGRSLDRATSLKGWFRLAFGDALAAAVRDDIHIFRGMMRTVNLVEKPGEFLNDPKTRSKVLRYMLRGRKRNAKARVQRGLERGELLDIVQTL